VQTFEWVLCACVNVRYEEARRTASGRVLPIDTWRVQSRICRLHEAAVGGGFNRSMQRFG